MPENNEAMQTSDDAIATPATSGAASAAAATSATSTETESAGTAADSERQEMVWIFISFFPQFN